MLKNKVQKRLSIHQRVVQVPGNIVSDMDGEKVILSINNGKYYNLGEVGGSIFIQLNEPVLIQSIISNLMKDYEVDRDVCEDQIISFLENMLSEELIDLA